MNGFVCWIWKYERRLYPNLHPCFERENQFYKRYLKNIPYPDGNVDRSIKNIFSFYSKAYH